MAPTVSTESLVVPRPMPNGTPALWQASAALRNVSSVQPSALGGLPGRIQGLHVDAGVLLHHVDARARPLDVGAGGGRHREPMSVRVAEIRDRVVDGAVLLDQRPHDVVDRRQVLGVLVRPPGAQRQDVVARFRLRLHGSRHQQLLALRGDVVDLDVDLLLRRPLLDERPGRGVGARHPMVPQADGELAGSVGGPDEWSRDCGRGRGGGSGYEATTRNARPSHNKSSLGCSCSCTAFCDPPTTEGGSGASRKTAYP